MYITKIILQEKMINQLVVVAGGKGSRLKNILLDKPKILIEVKGLTLLERYLDLAVKNQIKNIFFILGCGSEDVIKSIKTLRSKYSVKIEYVVEDSPLGTAGGLIRYVNKLDNEFFLQYGDLVVDIDYNSIKNYFEKFNCDFSMICHPSSHIYDSDIVKIDSDLNLLKIYRKPHPNSLRERNLVNSGVYLFKKDCFLNLKLVNAPIDLDADLIPLLLSQNKKCKVIRNLWFIKDIGTVDRLATIDKMQLPINGNYRKPAVFLDRDGTINKHDGHITQIKQISIYNDVFESLKNWNKANYWVFIVTNQPVVAKGMVTLAELQDIHNNFDYMFSKYNCYVDDYFICVHHPETGFENEVKELKIECNCRKPNTGLIEKALNNYPIDLDNSFYIGDTWRDEQLAYKMGLKFYGILRDYKNDKRNFRSDTQKISKFTEVST